MLGHFSTLLSNLADAQARIGTFIEQIYNRQRLHSALDYLSPQEHEQNLPRLRPGAPGRNRHHRDLSLISVSQRWGAAQ